jgi:hypothetical protein
VLLLIAGTIYLNRPAHIDMRKWIPLSVPIQLKVGEVQIPVFLAGLDSSYALFVEPGCPCRHASAPLSITPWREP